MDCITNFNGANDVQLFADGCIQFTFPIEGFSLIFPDRIFESIEKIKRKYSFLWLGIIVCLVFIAVNKSFLLNNRQKSTVPLFLGANEQYISEV